MAASIFRSEDEATSESPNVLIIHSREEEMRTELWTRSGVEMGLQKARELAENVHVGSDKVTLSRVMWSDNRDLFWWIPLAHSSVYVCVTFWFSCKVMSWVGTTSLKNHAVSWTCHTITHAIYMCRDKHPLLV